MSGKINVVFGFAYFVTTLALGMYLASKFQQPPEALQAWMQSSQHAMLKAAHVHGNMESLLNIVIGLLLMKFALKAWIARTVSLLLIVAAIFHSGMLYLTGLGAGGAAALTPIGAIALIAAMVLMALGFAQYRHDAKA